MFGAGDELADRKIVGETAAQDRCRCIQRDQGSGRICGRRGVYNVSADGGADDLLIAGAAEKISGQRAADLFRAGMRIFHEKGLSRQDHTGRTEAVLDRNFIDECALKRFQFPVGRETFDRRDAAALQLDGEDRAGVHGFIIHQNGACAAFSFLMRFDPAADAVLIERNRVEACMQRLRPSGCGRGRLQGAP